VWRARRRASTAALVEAPHPVLLPEASSLRRAPPRPPEKRQGGYEERFDDRTLWYDVLQAGDRIRLTGPPLLNLGDELGVSAAVLDGVDVTDRLALADGHNRGQRSWLAAAGSRLRLETAAGTLETEVSPDRAELFADSRVLLTLSLDNDLAWIRDWVRFHVRQLGIDAVLFYDNGSTAYPLAELADAIAGVPGIRTAVVVPWPFSYGPGSGPFDLWDSDFCQYGVLDHSRWRYLRRARLYVNCDIDELIVAPSPRTLERELAASPKGVVSLPGRWIDNVRDAEHAASPPRHAQFTRYDARAAPSPSKWAVDPRRLVERALPLVHLVDKVANAPSERILFRHFRGIYNGWHGEVGRGELEVGEHHLHDAELERAMRRAGLRP